MTAAEVFAKLERWSKWPRSAGAFQGMLVDAGGERLRVLPMHAWRSGWVPVLADPATQGVLTAIAWGATGTMPKGETPMDQATEAVEVLLSLCRFDGGA